MILKNIFLYPDLVEFANREQDLLIVKDQTRHLCNYLDRRLAVLKFHVDGFNRICVIGKPQSQEVYINSSSVLAVYIPFNMDECRSIRRSELGGYYSMLLKEGLKKCAAKYKIPIDELLSWLEEMKQDGYRNEWIFKEKTFKGHGIKCRLDCALTLDEFTLKLNVSKKGIDLFSELILTTPPDEIAFQYKFKDVLIENDNIVVITRLNSESERVLFRTMIPAS